MPQGEEKANMPRRHEIPDFEPPMDKARLDEYRRRIRRLAAVEVVPQARFCMGWEKADVVGKRVIAFLARQRSPAE